MEPLSSEHYREMSLLHKRHNAKHPESIKNEWICLFIIMSHTIVQFLHSHKLHCIGVISEGVCSQEAEVSKNLIKCQPFSSSQT